MKENRQRADDRATQELRWRMEDKNQRAADDPQRRLKENKSLMGAVLTNQGQHSSTPSMSSSSAVNLLQKTGLAVIVKREHVSKGNHVAEASPFIATPTPLLSTSSSTSRVLQGK